MQSIQQQAVTASLAAVRSIAGLNVVEYATTYRRPATGDSVAIPDIVEGRTEWTSDDPSEMSEVETRSVDWLIEFALIATDIGEPQPFDEIEVTRPGGVETYQVLPFGRDRIHFGYVDRTGRSTIRVHTKQV